MSQLTDLDLDALEAVAANGYMPTPQMFTRLLADLREARMTMPTRVEVYPLASDETGLWLLNPGGAWRSATILDDNETHLAAEAVLVGNGVTRAPVLHQTSCRTVIDEQTGRSAKVDTFLAAVAVEGLVPHEWPRALAIGVQDVEELGLPRTHGSAEAPVVNDANVLKHGLRHFRWLSDPANDATIARDLAALGWTAHLEPLTEDLARMFRQVHTAA